MVSFEGLCINSLSQYHACCGTCWGTCVVTNFRKAHPSFPGPCCVKASYPAHLLGDAEAPAYGVMTSAPPGEVWNGDCGAEPAAGVCLSPDMNLNILFPGATGDRRASLFKAGLSVGDGTGDLHHPDLHVAPGQHSSRQRQHMTQEPPDRQRCRDSLPQQCLSQHVPVGMVCILSLLLHRRLMSSTLSIQYREVKP